MFDTTFNPISYRSASQINEAMARVYGYMGMAVVVSLLTSMLVASSPALLQFFFTGVMKWIVIFLPLVAVFGVTIALNSEPPKPVALGLLAGFAAIMGLSMSVMFAVFTLGSIVSAFMGAAILFGVMSFYGYFTKTSLDSMGKFMFVGLIAIIIASIINLFLGSSLFAMVISALAIIIFLGLTAYDTQKIREAVSMDGNDTAEVIGALTLYLDFINIFTSLLQLTGSKNSD
jgi:FtsH-binding integral membrane protein